jgi:hypothetical protein
MLTIDSGSPQTRSLAVLAAGLILLAATARAEYTIPPLVEGQQTLLTVPDNGGKLGLTLARSGEAAEPIGLHVSRLVDPQGKAVEVLLELPGRPPAAQLTGIAIDPAVLSLTLVVPPLPSTGRFAGQLFLFGRQGVIKSYSIAVSRAAAAQYQIRPLSEDAANPTTLTASADGKAPLELTRAEGGTESLSLELSPFTDDQGDQVELSIQLADAKGAAASRIENVQIESPVVPLQLNVPDLPTPSTFKGQLFLLKQQALLKSYSFAVTRTKSVSAVLALDRQTANLRHTRCAPALFPEVPIPWCNGPDFGVRVREKSGQWPLEGIFARLEDNPGDVDLSRRLTFSIHGKDVADFWTSAPDPADPVRRIAAGQQLSVTGEFNGLKPGEYTGKIRFCSPNSKPDDAQLLALNVKIRDSWLWAALVLLGAAFISLVSTKFLRQRTERLKFLEKLEEIRREWLQRAPSTLPFVWTRAYLKQTEQLCRKFLLAGTDRITTRIAQLEEVLKEGSPLERITKLQNTIDSLQEDPMVIRRAQKCLRQIVAQLGTPPFDDKQAAEIDTRLKKLEEWFDPSAPRLQSTAGYWSDLEPDIKRLLATVPAHMDVFPDEDPVYGVVKQLVDYLEKVQAPVPTDLEEMVAAENHYAALMLLWQRWKMPEMLTDLANLQQGNRPIDTLFEAADKDTWERLKNGGIRLVPPEQGSPELFEAYQAMRFAVTPNDQTLLDNYLFLHGLRYEWRLTLQKRILFWWVPATRDPLTPVTDEPFVVQYAPRPGRLKATVTVRFGNRHMQHSAEQPILIGPSSVFGLPRAFNRMELLASGITLLLGVATGLSTYYVGNATFGAAKDYLSLFLWGVGADQAKNFVQLLSSSGEPAAPSQPDPKQPNPKA